MLPLNNNKNILVILTGSIACYKSCSIVSQLKQNGCNLKVILSPSSLEFIGKATIEGLTGEPPITDMYSSGHAMDHINLIRWADLILVAPATANYINKIANGIGDDLLTTLFLAHDFKKPFLIAPAMNTKMYLHPTTQLSINKLKDMNVKILETASGVLACGEIGLGKLLEPDLIVNELRKALIEDKTVAEAALPTQRKIKVLITSGGTSEPIDDVRIITNRSTGTTASAIADRLAESGIEITYLHSRSAVKSQNSHEQISYETFKDLQNLLFTKLKEKKFDFVIHAAAVSDYSVVPANGKLDSSAQELNLKLTRNPKLIDEIKKLSPQSKLMAFKLTSTEDSDLIKNKVVSLFNSADCNYVIQNNWSDIKNKNYSYKVFNKNLNFEKIDSLQNLSAFIFQEIVSGQELL